MKYYESEILFIVIYIVRIYIHKFMVSYLYLNKARYNLNNQASDVMKTG